MTTIGLHIREGCLVLLAFHPLLVDSRCVLDEVKRTHTFAPIP